jgi:hypothetical protein
MGTSIVTFLVSNERKALELPLQSKVGGEEEQIVLGQITGTTMTYQLDSFFFQDMVNEAGWFGRSPQSIMVL